MHKNEVKSDVMTRIGKKASKGYGELMKQNESFDRKVSCQFVAVAAF